MNRCIIISHIGGRLRLKTNAEFAVLAEVVCLNRNFFLRFTGDKSHGFVFKVFIGVGIRSFLYRRNICRAEILRSAASCYRYVTGRRVFGECNFALCQIVLRGFGFFIVNDRHICGGVCRRHSFVIVRSHKGDQKDLVLLCRIVVKHFYGDRFLIFTARKVDCTGGAFCRKKIVVHIVKRFFDCRFGCLILLAFLNFQVCSLCVTQGRTGALSLFGGVFGKSGTVLRFARRIAFDSFLNVCCVR